VDCSSLPRSGAALLDAIPTHQVHRKMPADDPLGRLISLTTESQEDLATSLHLSSSSRSASPISLQTSLGGSTTPGAPHDSTLPAGASQAPQPPCSIGAQIALPPPPENKEASLPQLPGSPEMSVNELLLQWRADLEASGEPMVRDVAETVRGVRVAPTDDEDDIEANPITLDSGETIGGRLYSNIDTSTLPLLSDNFVGDEGGEIEEEDHNAVDADSDDSDDSDDSMPNLPRSNNAEGKVLSRLESRGFEDRHRDITGPTRPQSSSLISPVAERVLSSPESEHNCDEHETPIEAFSLDPDFDYDAVPSTSRPPIADVAAEFERQRREGAETHLDILG